MENEGLFITLNRQFFVQSLVTTTFNLMTHSGLLIADYLVVKTVNNAFRQNLAALSRRDHTPGHNDGNLKLFIYQDRRPEKKNIKELLSGLTYSVSRTEETVASLATSAR